MREKARAQIVLENKPPMGYNIMTNVYRPGVIEQSGPRPL